MEEQLFCKKFPKMNELYKILQNVHEIAKANNIFLVAIDTKIQTLEEAIKDLSEKVDALEKSMVIDTSEPTAVGTEE